MGRNTATAGLPHYREVLVDRAIRAVRDSVPAMQAFAERRAWLGAAAEAGGWRAFAVAAGAVPDQANTR